MTFRNEKLHGLAEHKYKRGVELCKTLIEICEKSGYDELDQYIAAVHFNQYCRAVVKMMVGGKTPQEQQIADMLMEGVDKGMNKFTDEKVAELREMLRSGKDNGL